jgi:hypothetical protein
VLRLRPALFLIGLVLAALPSQAVAAPAIDGTPKLGHVFIIMLENENADSTFGPDAPAYLAKTLPSRGAFLPNYYGTGHASLDNYISMVSGQAPNPQTQADCQIFSDFTPGTPAADGQVIGSGCVYPAAVKTIGDQLQSAGRNWAGYMEDMAAKAPAEPATCRHPAIGTQDNTQSAEVGDQYATRHNPFMYFHSIIDDQATCDAHVVDLSRLSVDLKRNRTTPAYSFITPNLCHDGHDEPCVNGEPGGLVSANDFLEKTVPEIVDSSAYSHRGLIIVTFDEAEASGGEADSSACCNEQPGPNTPSPGGFTPGPGGGRVGAVLLSPCIAPGTLDETPYNHYSMLRSAEDGLGLDHLGYAGASGLSPFGAKTFTQSDCGEQINLKAKPKHPPSGERVTIKLRIRTTYARCRRGVTIKSGSHKAKTNSHGRTAIKLPVGDAKLKFKASKHGCLGDTVVLKPG